MDELLSSSARRGAQGDEVARAELGSHIHRTGASAAAQQVFLELLASNPQNKDFRDQYIGVGGFCPIRVNDKFLGDAFTYHNLRIDGNLHMIIQSNEALGYTDWNPQKPGNHLNIHRTWDAWKLYVARKEGDIKVTSAKIEAAIRIGWHSIRDHPAFEKEFQHFLKRNGEIPLGIRGKITFADGISGTLEEYAIDGGIVTRELQIPFMDYESPCIIPIRPYSEGVGPIQNADGGLLLKQILGVDQEYLEAVLSHPRTDGDGNPVVMDEYPFFDISTPSVTERKNHPQGVLKIGELGGWGPDRHGLFLDDYASADSSVSGWRLGNSKEKSI